MFTDLDAVSASYHRCRASEGFFDRFYERFLAKSPDIAHKFRHTDFKRQKLMLRESLISMLLFNQNIASALEDVERLADRHSRQQVDIPPYMYKLWLDSLCETIAEHDPEFTPQLEQEWRAAMKGGIDLLISRY
ncbi:MAG: globin domain-containing protein [Pirellulales bacterium]